MTLCARTHADVANAAEALEARGGRARAVALDVADPDAVRGFVGSEDAFDILVNNAGTNRPGPFTETSVADYDLVTDLNVRAAFFVAQAVADKLLKAGRPGSLIHMSSQMGHVGAANRVVYCATKWALEGMSKAMAVELAPHGIRSNTLCPTFAETPMTRPFLEDEDFRQSLLSKIKLGRLAQPQDLMGAVLLLASDASAMMTGTSLVVDGGWTAE